MPPYNTTQLKGHTTLWVGLPYGKLHPDKLSGHMHHGSGKIMVLVCNMILQSCMIKGSYDFMGGTPLW